MRAELKVSGHTYPYVQPTHWGGKASHIDSGGGEKENLEHWISVWYYLILCVYIPF